MIKQILLLVTLFLFSFTPALAQVYHDCSTPAANPTAHTWYVDPVNGTATGDGSRAKPWNSLNDLIAGQYFANAPQYWDPVKKVMVKANPNGPIKSGDTILLMTGEYGDITFQGSSGTAAGLVGFNNTDFITVQAAPGQTPHLASLNLLGGTKWVFRGLNITRTGSTPPPRGSLIYVGGEYKDVIIDNNYVGNSSDTSKWTMQTWNTDIFTGIVIHAQPDPYGSCVAITNNTFKNVKSGIGESSNNTLIANNSIDYFTDDGIDFAGSHLLITGNFITNSVENGDGIHRDGMQGQQLAAQTDVTIIHNNVIRQTTDSNPFPGNLQGISAFDGTLSNFNIVGNLVITNAPQGFGWSGVDNLVVQYNTLLIDNGRHIECPATGGWQACAAAVVQPTSPWPPSINIGASKTGHHSNNVDVSFNITTHMGIDPLATNVTVRGNACPGITKACNLALPVAGKNVWYAKPGTYGDRNYILP